MYVRLAPLNRINNNIKYKMNIMMKNNVYNKKRKLFLEIYIIYERYIWMNNINFKSNVEYLYFNNFSY